MDKIEILNKLKEELNKHEDPDDEEYETMGYRSGLIFCIDLIENEE